MVSNQVRKLRIQNFPTEILFKIYDSLSPAASLIVLLTCRQFYLTFAQYAPSCKELSEEEKYEYLKSLEKDGLRSIFFASCSGCETYHPNTQFMDHELLARTASRRCIRTAKLLWVNPQAQFSFNDVNAMKDLNTKRTEVSGVVFQQLGVKFLSFGNMSMATSHPILTLPRSKFASKEKVMSILDGFAITACPHLRLCDPVVASGYDPYGEIPVDTQVPHLYDAADKPGSCLSGHCHTKFYWTIHVCPENQEWKTIYVHIYRSLGLVQNPLSYEWLAQLAVPNTPRLEELWRESMRWKEEITAMEQKQYEKELTLDPSPKSMEKHEVETRLLRNKLTYLYHPRRSIMFPYTSRYLHSQSEWSANTMHRPSIHNPRKYPDRCDIFSPLFPYLASDAALEAFRERFKDAVGREYAKSFHKPTYPLARDYSLSFHLTRLSPNFMFV